MASTPSVPVDGSSANVAEPSDFEPTLLFFYGTLRIPSVLKRILKLTGDPVLTPAEVPGYKIKLWGPYPALIKCEDSTPENPSVIKGSTYKVTTKAHLDRLKTYEGANYAMEHLTIHEISPETEQKTEKQGATFVWDGLPTILKDGEFNPEEFTQS
ncbi:hypothetical protein TWF481_004019 [Arthrobotrys musiformis]|uniref:Putative gamma-glutamylcyclotransferase n=1 Tax=Arthrobotrys musiformis TaxID=47236 RepID=A0AAV9WK74_9PEZI